MQSSCARLTLSSKRLLSKASLALSRVGNMVSVVTSHYISHRDDIQVAIYDGDFIDTSFHRIIVTKICKRGLLWSQWNLQKSSRLLLTPPISSSAHVVGSLQRHPWILSRRIKPSSFNNVCTFAILSDTWMYDTYICISLTLKALAEHVRRHCSYGNAWQGPWKRAWWQNELHEFAGGFLLHIVLYTT